MSTRLVVQCSWFVRVGPGYSLVGNSSCTAGLNIRFLGKIFCLVHRIMRTRFMLLVRS